MESVVSGIYPVILCNVPPCCKILGHLMYHIPNSYTINILQALSICLCWSPKTTEALFHLILMYIIRGFGDIDK